MTDYLLLRLYGALASWGEQAVGEVRHTAAQPSRSALLGLLAAALGVERQDDLGQQALADGYRFAVYLDGVGSPLRDYHTVQSGVPDRKTRFRTRRQELAADKLSTIVSSREYRCDMHAVVAVQALDKSPYSLTELAQALRQPHFVLYLGRKSCPLALPPAPQLVRAATLKEAFAQVRWPSLSGLTGHHRDNPWPDALDRRAFGVTDARLFWEDGMEPGEQPSYEHIRHDQPISRRRWQYAPRREWVRLPGEDA